MPYLRDIDVEFFGKNNKGSFGGVANKFVGDGVKLVGAGKQVGKGKLLYTCL